MAKRRRRKNRGGKYLVLLLLLALAIVAYNRIFIVREIQVEGVDESRRDHVAALSGIQLGESIFRPRESRVRMALSADSYLEFDSMTRVYPHTIRLSVRLRAAAGAVAYSGIYLLVDGEGRILETTPNLPSDMPAVTSVKVSSANIGTKLTSTQSDQVAMLLSIIQALSAQPTLPPMRQIDVGDRNDLYLVTSSGVKIILGDSEQLDRKMVWVVTALEEMAASDFRGGIVDVSSGKNAVYAPSEAQSP